MASTLYGLLGWPVGHSVSPAMVNAAFNFLGIEAYYTAFGVPPEDFATAVHGLTALRAGGVNVTIPHKQQALQVATQISPEAKLAGAVNTLKFFPDSRKILGHNTDVAGWWTSLQARSEHKEDWGNVLVLGAGGASRAVLAGLALHTSNARVQISARKQSQAEQMAAAFASHLDMQVVDWEHREQSVSEAELVVNTTPVGMWPKSEFSPVTDGACFGCGQVVQDLVYRPLDTQFLQLAALQGATVVDGLSMLVEQGALAIEFWTGYEAPRALMQQAALEALRTGGLPDKMNRESI